VALARSKLTLCYIIFSLVYIMKQINSLILILFLYNNLLYIAHSYFNILYIYTSPHISDIIYASTFMQHRIRTYVGCVPTPTSLFKKRKKQIISFAKECSKKYKPLSELSFESYP
jgi:hypothetical protein